METDNRYFYTSVYSGNEFKIDITKLPAGYADALIHVAYLTDAPKSGTDYTPIDDKVYPTL